MGMRVGAGVELELASKADLEGSIDRLARLLERPHARFERISAGRPPRAGNLIFAINLGRPAGGTLWRVQWIVLSPDDPTAASAVANVRAAAFVGSCPPDTQLNAAFGLDIAGCILTGLVVPSTTTVPDQSIVYSNEDLYILIAGTGTVAGAIGYHATAGVMVLPQTAEALTW